MSKAITLVLVMLALSVLVVGCGSETAPADTGAPVDPASQAQADTAIDDTVLSEGDDVQIGELIE